MQGKIGDSLMEVAKEHDIDLEGVATQGYTYNHHHFPLSPS